MRRPLVLAALSALVALAPAAVAQTKDNIVDPGMSKTQVIEHLGQPSSVKTADTTIYMFYPNGCLKTCGMNDVVILVHDKVVDAIFRDPNRKYTGESSSPNQITAAQAIKTGNEKKNAPASMKPQPPPDAGKAEVRPAPKPLPAPPPAPTDSTATPATPAPPPPPKADTAPVKPPPA